MAENGLTKKLNVKSLPPLSANLTRLLGLLFTAAVYFYDMRYMVLHGREYIDSDMAAEMILADKLNQTGSILSTDWYYSSEIRVLSMQWFYRLGLLLFPSDWSMARTFGEGLALLVLALGAFLLTRKLCSDGLEYWAAGFSLCPLGFWYFWQTIYGGQYIPYALFSLYTILLILDYAEAKNKRVRLLCCIGLGIMAVASGMQGVRQLMVLYAPLLLSLLFIRNKKKMAFPILFCFVLSTIGYLINTHILAEIYSFRHYDDLCWGEGSGSWLETLKWYFEGFGYVQNYSTAIKLEYIPGKEKIDTLLFSFYGIAAGLGLLIGFAVFGAMVYLLLHFKKLSEKDSFITAVVFCMLFVIGFVFTYLDGAKQYWQQTMVFGLVLLVVAIRNFDWEDLHFSLPAQTMRLIALGVIAVFAVISGKGTENSTLEYPMRAELGLCEVTDWIMENTSYRKGVAEFWLGDAVMEWSNGELEMYVVESAEHPGADELYGWLQSVHHSEDYPEHDYVVISSHRDDQYAGTYLTDTLHARLIFDNGAYCVFAVD